MKKLLLLAALTMALAPYGVKAEGNNWDDKPKHRHVNGDEMAGIGVGAAALVGLAGYLLLRRRHSA